MKHILQVGEKERHELVIQYSYWGFKVTIYVDGNIISTINYGIGKASTKFKVGKEEIHDVEVKITQTLTGIIYCTLYVFVDEKLVYRNV